ncbi:MAG: nitroreductase family protein [Anaerolineales bacterium]
MEKSKDFFQVVEERRSMRAFAPAPVEEDKLQRILEVANRAPSAGNLQGYEIFVIRKAGQKQALVEAAYDQRFIAEAPLVLIFCANPSRSAVRYLERGRNLYSVQDATIACTYAMLAATALGLSSVWVGAFDEQAVRRAADIPSDLVPVAMLPIGYASEAGYSTPRRSLDEIVHER